MFYKTLIGKNVWLIKSFFIIGIVLLSACKTGVIVKETYQIPAEMGKIIILPFQDMSEIYGENVNVRCPLLDNVFMTGKVAKGAVDILTDHMFILLKDRKSFELLPTSQAEGVLSSLLSRNKNRLSELELFLETGRALDADAVIVGYIYRFKERVGTGYSVDSPASVGFDIHFISVVDGRIMWSGIYDETQRSLSEDLFQLGTFLRRKARWITAEKMASSGLEDLLKKLP